MGRNLKPRQEPSQSLEGKEEADYHPGSNRPTVPRVQEETSSKSSSGEEEEEEYSARRTVEREGREVRREMRGGIRAGARWSERGIDLPRENGLVERKSAKEGKTRSHAEGLSKRQSQGTRPETDNTVRRNPKPKPTGSERDLDMRADMDAKEDWGHKGKGWGEGGVWERARRDVYPTTSESSDPEEEATYYAAVRREGAQSPERERQEKVNNQGGQEEKYRDRPEEKRGMRRGWTEEIEQGWRAEMSRSGDLEKSKHQERQWRPEKHLGSLQSDGKILRHDTKLGALPRDIGAWRQPLEPEGAARTSRREKEARSRWEGPVDWQSSPDERHVSNIERWRGQDLEKEQERERLRLGSGAVTAVYKEHHFSSRA